MQWDIAGAVVLSGLVIVFAILSILIGMVTILGKLAGGNAGAQKEAPVAAPKPVVVNAAQAQPAPKAVQAGISEETVAVISAAVAATMEAESPGAAYVVTGIQRAPGRPVWGFAGMQQNTRPF